MSTSTVVPWGGKQGRNAGATYGARVQDNLQACFPNSPLWEENSDYSTTVVHDIGVSMQGNGGDGDAYTGNASGTVDDGGQDYSSFNLNFEGSSAADLVPNLADVETGGGGAPASPYMPNPSSPGPGSTSYVDQPEYTGALPAAGGEYGVGLGYQTSPSTTSPNIAAQTLGAYTSGRSYAGSDGVE